jgi:hypothetical protein
VKSIVELHVFQLVGSALLPYATCTVPFPASVGHVVFNLTFALFVYSTPLLIVKLPFIGAELSTINCPLVLVVTFVFHALSTADHDSTHK